LFVLSSLIRHGFFITSGALEQKFLGIENAILTHMTGHDRLCFIAEEVGFWSYIDDLHAGASGVNDSLVEGLSKSAFCFELGIIAWDVGNVETES
jgi:hypothetical protein